MSHRLVTVLVLFLGAFAFARYQEQPEEPVTEQELLVRPAELAGAPALSVDMAFMMAMDRSRTAGGAVILHGCDEPAKKVVRYRGNTLQEVLNDIVTADPSYRWEVENGVVNLLPAKGVPNLLNLQIASYDSGEAWSLATAGAYLLALPQVRKRATVMGFSQGITGSGLSGAPPLGPPTPVRKLLGVRLQDVTLLEALNALVRANRHGEWIYHETHCQLENNFQVQFPE